MKSFEEYVNYYKKYKRCLGQMRNPKHTLNEKELKSKYEKYCKSEQKKEDKKNKLFEEKLLEEKEIPIDNQWENVYTLVHKRDKEYCRLKLILSIEELKELNQNPISLLNQLDVAHVIPRSASKNLYYDLDNLVLLNRISHSWLDTYKNPINGKPIKKEERDMWWKRIVGEQHFNKLQERK
ncbi:MAG: hypothetical protein WC942_12045 [Clostridia bacterium]